ncbi:lysozyme inhibitor LprI family protein [Swingsia samuiensis]|uniref:DUF1311 domain-containing protein n=1 Tax=Swingsia samuiensis TaxID=1293412 RepID=A0A4Y6UIP1_9PROT|nr:lysozyme inhibitor LprI family protein [Swingsia samuiensis]QDH17422.1 DUF1311 domain-containing protein [Swingsia samuiensis]
MKTLSFITTLALSTSICFASDFEQCRKQADSVDPQIIDCQDQEMAREDAAINKLYQQILEKLKSQPKAVSTMKDAERAWIKYREANCGLISVVFGDASADHINKNDCFIDMTSTRIKELEKWNTSRTVNEE